MQQSIRVVRPETGQVIEWLESTEGEWDAWRILPEDPDDAPSYRLYDLDGVDLGQVFATINQFFAGDLPEIYLQPRQSDLKRRMARCEGHYDDDLALTSGEGIGEGYYCDGRCN